jgi:sodium transport system permease protein
MTHPVTAVFAKEFRENLRDRRTLMAALILGPLFGPLLFCAALFLMIERGAGSSEEPLELAVAHGERAPNLVSHLRQHGVRVQPVDYEDAQARAAIRSHAHKVILVIPPDYAERLAAAEPAPLLLYADSSDTLDQRERARVGDAINGYGQLIARLRLVVRGVDPLTLSPLAVQDVDVSTPASRSVVALGTLSYIVLLTMLMGGLYLSIDATAGERERGSLEPLLTVPVRREQLIYGKILAACAYMALSLVLTVTAFAILLRFVGLERFGMSVNFGPFAALCAILYSLPLVPLGAALMTTVAAFTRSYREAQTYLGLILIVPTLPLVFASLMGLRPSAWLMAVPSLSQHFLITALLRDEAVPAEHLALSMGVTLALGLLLAAAAGRLYHREALLG